jgi:hypothetical protein
MASLSRPGAHGNGLHQAVGEGGDQRSVAQVPRRIGRDGVDQPPPFRALQHRRLAGLHHVLGAALFTPGAEWVCWSASIWMSALQLSLTR